MSNLFFFDIECQIFVLLFLYRTVLLNMKLRYVYAVSHIDRYCELVLDRILLPWLRIGFIWNLTDKGRREKMLLKTLHSFTEDIVRKRMAERKGGQGHDANNFLDLLLDIAGESGSAVMTDLDIREQTDTFTFGVSYTYIRRIFKCFGNLPIFLIRP